MEKRRLGKTDMDVSILGFGGMEIGYQHISLSTAKRLLNEVLDSGINVVDTAECYSTSEELIGEAIAARRKDFYLFTKCGHESGWTYPDWRPESLFRSVERSLKRLKTNCVDLIQLHSCSEAELRQGKVIETLQRMRERGYTRYIGYSGDSKAALFVVESGQFDALQISLSIADQEALELVLPAAEQRSLGVMAKRPLTNMAWHNGDRPPSDSYGRTYWERLQRLKYEFLQGDSNQAISTALRFSLSVPGIHTAIVGTTKPERIAENAKAVAAGRLSEQAYENIRARWRQVARASWVGQT
jgi:aryl-alcohol dehydrogenase-like predicted oxidoreductase